MMQFSLKEKQIQGRTALWNRVIIMASVIGLVGVQNVQCEWKMGNGPLMTKWAKEVSPKNALPDYPRPQMVRKDWLNLNGIWEFSIANPNEPVPTGKTLPEEILVPYPVESALSGVMKHPERMWYRRTFVLPKRWNAQRILIHFGAVDWETKIYVNGKEIGSHQGGYDGFGFDITDALNASGEQEIVVGVYDPTDKGDQPRGKQVNKPEGIYYTGTSGIWQTVWLEPVPDTYITNLIITPDVDESCVSLKVNAIGNTKDVKIQASVTDGNRIIGKGQSEIGNELRIPISNAKLWSPDKPNLYGLKVTLQQENKKIDGVESYFGMRKIEIADDGKVKRILLNHKFVFEVGTLDQGFWPDGIYTAPTDDALKSDIEMHKKLGFNLIRKHVKVEPERWYYWADKLGILVWQDMPSANNQTESGKNEFESELSRIIEGRRNHPAIIMWVIFNEGWGQFDTERIVKWVKEIDPSRLVNNASGWTDKNCGDILDMHNYPDPKAPEPDGIRAIVLGEFGGLGPGDPRGHTWSKQNWSYQKFTGKEELTRRYVDLLKQVYQLKETPGLSAAVYTQITDVERECNGLLTYDRAVLKMDLKKIRNSNLGIFP